MNNTEKHTTQTDTKQTKHTQNNKIHINANTKIIKTEKQHYNRNTQLTNRKQHKTQTTHNNIFKHRSTQITTNKQHMGGHK